MDLGYQNNNSKGSLESNKDFFAKFANNPSSFYNDDPFYSMNAKVRCHYCCLKGHVSFDYFVKRFILKSLIWVPKQPTNIVGTKSWLPLGASSAGTHLLAPTNDGMGA